MTGRSSNGFGVDHWRRPARENPRPRALWHRQNKGGAAAKRDAVTQRPTYKPRGKKSAYTCVEASQAVTSAKMLEVSAIFAAPSVSVGAWVVTVVVVVPPTTDSTVR